LQKKAWNVQKAGKKGGLKLTPTRSSRGLRKSVAYREKLAERTLKILKEKKKKILELKTVLL